MITCEFSIIKYVPNIARFEPVNIGISLMNKNKKQIHNKFISNFDELFQRLGVDGINGLEKSFENYKSIIDADSDDHLWKMHERFHGSIYYSKPLKITTENSEDEIKQIFKKMISVKSKKLDISEHASTVNIKKKIRAYLSKFNFSKENYRERYCIKIKNNMPQTRQFAFLKHKKLRYTIDTFNFSDTQAYSSLRLFMYDIQAIIQSKHHAHNKPCIFSVDDSEHTSDEAKQTLKLLNMKKIDVISTSKQEDKLEQIRTSILQ